MSNLLFHIDLHYDASKLNEPDTRQRVEEALNIACSHLERHRNSIFVGYKIREITDLEPESRDDQ